MDDGLAAGPRVGFERGDEKIPSRKGESPVEITNNDGVRTDPDRTAKADIAEVLDVGKKTGKNKNPKAKKSKKPDDKKTNDKETDEKTEKGKNFLGMGPKTQETVKAGAKGTFEVLTVMVKGVLKGTGKIIKYIFRKFPGGGTVLVGVIILAVLFGGGLKLCSRLGLGVKGKVSKKTEKFSDIIKPDNKTNQIKIGNNKYSYQISQEIKQEIWGITVGTDVIEQTVKADVETGYTYNQLSDLPIRVSTKTDKDEKILREEIDIQQMPVIDTLAVLFLEGTGIELDESMITKIGLDDEEIRELKMDSMNKEKLGKIMEKHTDNLIANGEEYRRLVVQKMRMMFVKTQEMVQHESQTKAEKELAEKTKDKDTYMKVHFVDWFGTDYVYAIGYDKTKAEVKMDKDGKMDKIKIILIYSGDTPAPNDGAPVEPVSEQDPDDYGNSFGRTYPENDEKPNE